MFRASSAHLQEDTVVYMQHMVLSLSMRVPGVLSVHSLSENSMGMLILFKYNKIPFISCTCFFKSEPQLS